MGDKQVSSEKTLRQLLALLEKQSKKDKNSIMKLWKQLKPDVKKMPHQYC
jgi:hypothetical protein